MDISVVAVAGFVMETMNHTELGDRALLIAYTKLPIDQ